MYIGKGGWMDESSSWERGINGRGSSLKLEVGGNKDVLDTT